MTEKIIDVEIFNRKYRIKVKGEENEKYLSQLTSYVDQKMREVAEKSRSIDTTKIAVLAALNITDEFFLNRKKLARLSEVIEHLESKIGGLEDHLFRGMSSFKHVRETTK